MDNNSKIRFIEMSASNWIVYDHGKSFTKEELREQLEKLGFSNSDIEKMINVAKGGEGNLPFFNGKCGKDSQFFATAYQGSDRWKNWYGGEKLNMKPFHMGL